MTRPSAALVALALAASLGCDALPGRPTQAEVYRDPRQILDFATLYARNCAGCHGSDGTYGAALPLNDPLYLQLAGVNAIRAAIARGVPGTPMSPFLQENGGTLDDAQVDSLAEGLVTTWGGATRLALPPYSEAASRAAGIRAGSPQRGAAVYARRCANCHGADGGGGAKGGSVVEGSYLALSSDQSLRNTVIAGRTDLGMPDFRGKSGQRAMSAQEVSDVVAWLAARRVPFPGQPFPQEGGG